MSQIPVDQVIDAMREVGEKMDVSLRETGIGGVAGSPRGQEVGKIYSSNLWNNSSKIEITENSFSI
ncbi:L-serine dehydratase, alpha chain [[Clostridium] hylemonae DSM 15053]|nr:L-serine dehydratase, alpha chain [[Clostridium] hylemonae DSM 15053]